MADKTIVEKAAEKVGYGLAMAEDVAGSVKTAVGAALTTVTKALKKAPPQKATKKVAKKAVAQRAAKKEPAKTAVKKTAARKSPAKKTVAKKASKKTVKTPAKKAGRARK